VGFDDSNAPWRSAQGLGRYQPMRRIAVGGMAELYLACAVGPGDFRKVVALKRLLPQHALDPQLLQMFLDEARVMARMAHPNIPQVHDVDDGAGSPDRAPYFAMEYVHGTDLRGVLNEADGPLPIPQLLAVGAAVAAGLHYAHEMRSENGDPLELVHRDVSPSNVLISFGGSVKITDFGVAKWIQQRSLTYAGQLKGKFAHMSPEQCQGQPLDRRSDVFALGTLLYEMATGRPAFAADSDFELMSQIVNVDIRPPERPGGTLPAELSAIISRTLARSREQRYASTQEVQLELERFARDHQLVISPLSVADFLGTLFNARVSEWREAMKSGWTLAEHLARAADGTGVPPPASRRLSPSPERTATDAHAAAIPPPATSTAASGHRWRMTVAVVVAVVVLSWSLVELRRPPAGGELAAETRARSVSERTTAPTRTAPLELSPGTTLTTSRPPPVAGAGDAPRRITAPSSKASVFARATAKSPRATASAGASTRLSVAPEGGASPADEEGRGRLRADRDALPSASPPPPPPPLPRTLKVWDPDSPVPP
jgi:serine/threonine protein kinase